MSTAYENLVELGAPDLPEPFFYRIKAAHDDGDLGDVVVQVRRRNPRVGSRYVAGALVNVSDTSPYLTAAHAVAEGCRAAWADAQQDARVRDDVASLLGDHP